MTPGMVMLWALAVLVCVAVLVAVFGLMHNAVVEAKKRDIELDKRKAELAIITDWRDDPTRKDS